MIINVDLLHHGGKIPDRYYNQINGKSANENYQEFCRQRSEWISQQRKAKAQNQQIEAELSELIENTLDKLLKDL